MEKLIDKFMLLWSLGSAGRVQNPDLSSESGHQYFSVPVYLDHGGCGFYGAVIQVNKNNSGVAKKAIRETFNVFQSLQRVVAVDTDVNLYDPNEVNWAITTRFNPDRDLIILPDQMGHILNPMVKINPDGKGGTVTKMGLDATAPYPKTKMFERVKFMDVNLSTYEIHE